MAESNEASISPYIILIISGKRKSGKDYLTSVLSNVLGRKNCFIFRVGDPIKEQHAKKNNLDFGKLLDGSSSYKEIYRKEMVAWGEEQRNKDPGIFCRLASAGPGKDRPIWVLTDARRETDVQYFVHLYGQQRVVTIRVTSSEDVRKRRGWQFTAGIDDCATECGLDHFKFHYTIENNGTAEELEVQCRDLCEKYLAKFLRG